MYDKPESSLVSIGVSTKPYPLFRLPGVFRPKSSYSVILLTVLGLHKSSVAYTSSGQRRYNQPFRGTNYGPEFVQGDVIGVGYRPRTGSIFFTRNGKKLEDVAHALKSQNFFPTVGANGPCTVHVNFGQSGFVFIEANVKKWGLAPMTGSLAPPPPYGSEQGSILLEAGRDGVRQSQSSYGGSHGHSRSRSGHIRVVQPMSPGPERSPTEISLAQLAHIPSREDIGEGTSRSAENYSNNGLGITSQVSPQDLTVPPPEYTSPEGSLFDRRGSHSVDVEAEFDEDDEEEADSGDENRPILSDRDDHRDQTPIPSYDAAIREDRRSTGA